MGAWSPHHTPANSFNLDLSRRKGTPTCCTEGHGLQDAAPVRTEARGVTGQGGLAANTPKVVSKSTWRQTLNRRLYSVNSEPSTYRRLRTGKDCFPWYENRGFKY